MCGPLRTSNRAIGSPTGPKAGPLLSHFNWCCWIPFLLSWFSLLFLTTLQQASASGLSLNSHIRHFEPVFYDASLLRKQHRRAKREASRVVAFDFTAHNREFKVRLRQDRSVFADDVVLESTDGPVQFDFQKVYSGTLEDDDLVEVTGVVTKEGLFDGHISTPNELFYLEPAHRYLQRPEFHSVMYKASDVLHPRPARCASQQLHLRGRVHNPWMRPHDEALSPGGHAFEPHGVPVGPPRGVPVEPSSISSTEAIKRALEGVHHRGPLHPKHAAVNFSNKVYRTLSDKAELPRQESESESDSVPLQTDSAKPSSDSAKPSSSSSFRNWTQNRIPSAHNGSKFDPPPFGHLNTITKSKLKRKILPHSRRKRATIDPKKTTCMLYLQADHLFYREEGTEEACIDKITRHVQRVNNIYKVTDFDLDGRPDNIGFMIKRIKIHTENATRDPTYRFPGNYGVEKFLELFSEEDYDAFCLAYMFTYRDFEGGTLGLAWTGDLKNAGGVCEKNGHYRGSLKSLNTGIVTLLNYGKKVPPAVSHVTLAHEIGHNFGSPHDPEKDLRCTPGGEDGNYIMFARATSGDKRNNNKFSPCSLKQINSVLNSKARDSKGCFTEPQRAICGNGVVEEGEECDCGWQEDCEEPCCFPMVNNPKPHQNPCTLRPGKICSPSQGPCCNYQCDYKQGDQCREDNGCRDAAFCDGRASYCPPSINKENKTICKEEFVCFKGECTGSICLAYGLESCQCKRKSGDLETKSCELCCKLPGEDNSCLSSFDWNIPPFDVPDMFAKPGTPCDNYKGYCDVFQKCREVDPSGPLATLRKILLSNESLANLQRWIIERWYVVLLVALSLIILLILITRLFGKKAAKLHSSKRRHHKTKTTKKKNIKKKKTIVHKNTANGDTFFTAVNGATPDGPNHVVHPTVVRAHIPFKRKVNEVRRAATKAKRVAKSQLSGKAYRKSNGIKRTDGGVTSPTDSEKSGVLNGISNSKVCPATSPIKTREKERVVSSRFSIISFKTFKPKASSPVKVRAQDKRKSNSSGHRKPKTKPRSRSPDKKRKVVLESGDHGDKVKLRNPAKRNSLEDEKKKIKHRSHSPDKAQRSSSPDKTRKHRPKSPDKARKAMNEGNWLINKFLADEERHVKPVVNGSLNGSLNGSPNGSPLMNGRTGSTTALLTTSTHASPIRGFINEAFIGSPRGVRTHSSLRVTKSVSPEGNFDLLSGKYRRSISMEAYNRQQSSPDKRKRLPVDDGVKREKKRRVSSPEKAAATSRPHSLAEPERKVEKSSSGSALGSSKSLAEMSKRLTPRRSSVSLPSSAHNSFSSVPDRIREKLSLITSSPEGSLTSIIAHDAEPENVDSNSCSIGQSAPTPKEWV